MANSTVNLGLVKPTTEEMYSITVTNSNMDIIDSAIEALSDAIEAKQSIGSTIYLYKNIGGSL